jgi:eukaryotic-like serine/threonine-protein kinase
MEHQDKLDAGPYFDRSNGTARLLAARLSSSIHQRNGSPIDRTNDDELDDSLGTDDIDPAFADLFDKCQERIQAGERIDLETLVAQHPAWADQIRQLLPAIQRLATIGQPLDSARSRLVDNDRGLLAADGDATGGGRNFGDFRIIREVGRGGMGIVYEAEQISLARKVALKVLPAAATLDARAIERFQLEARVAGWLRHPGIVSVFGVGDVDGMPYYAMPYIEGGSLADLIAELRGFAAAPAESFPSALASGMLSGRFEPTRRGMNGQRLPGAIAAVSLLRPALSIKSASYVRSVVRLGIQAAEALGYAHDQGIVHRDVKPANLLLDPYGDLWVADFGMADVQGNAGLTMTGDTPGTLRYMSPEQAAGRRALVDRRSDVYSLGATLYELLTLQPAVPGTDRQDILRRIAEEEPASIRKLVPTVPFDLATIVAKALAKDPVNRYETAWDLADDLRRFQDGQPILARPVGPLARSWRWCRRKPALAALAAGLVISVVVGFAGITWAWRDAVRLRRTAQVAEREAKAAAANALAQVAKSDAINRFLTSKLPSHRAAGLDQSAVRAAELDVLDRAANEVGRSFGDQPEIEVEIREIIASRYHVLAAYEKCEAQYRAVLKTMERIPAKAPHLIRAELGHCLWHLRRYDEAEALLVPAVDELIRDRGPTDRNTINCARYLESVYESQKRYVDAEPLMRRLLANSKASLGESHPETVMALHSVGGVLRKQKKYAESEQTLRQCLDRSREVLGPRHSFTLRSLYSLGEVLEESGHPELAEPLLRECLEMQTKVVGSEAHDTLQTMSALASTLKTRGQLDEAEVLLRRCLDGLRRLAPGDEDELTATTELLDEVIKVRAGLVAGRGFATSSASAPAPSVSNAAHEQAARRDGKPD